MLEVADYFLGVFKAATFIAFGAALSQVVSNPLRLAPTR